MKDRWLFILMNACYNEIAKWRHFGGIVAMGIHEMLMVKREPIGKL